MLWGHSPLQPGRPTWTIRVRYARPGSDRYDTSDLWKASRARDQNRWVHTSWFMSPEAVIPRAKYALAWKASLEVLQIGRAKTLTR